MIFSALVCYCSLDAGQKSYDLGEVPIFVRQSIEKTPIKLKVGKWQATKLPGPWIRSISLDKCCSLRAKWGSF